MMKMDESHHGRFCKFTDQSCCWIKACSLCWLLHCWWASKHVKDCESIRARNRVGCWVYHASKPKKTSHFSAGSNYVSLHEQGETNAEGTGDLFPIVHVKDGHRLQLQLYHITILHLSSTRLTRNHLSRTGTQRRCSGSPTLRTV